MKDTLIFQWMNPTTPFTSDVSWRRQINLKPWHAKLKLFTWQETPPGQWDCFVVILVKQSLKRKQVRLCRWVFFIHKNSQKRQLSGQSVYWDECVFLRCVCAGMALHLTALFIGANLWLNMRRQSIRASPVPIWQTWFSRANRSC